MIHFRDHNIHLILNGIIHRLHIVEIPGDQQFPAILFPGIFSGMVRQLTEIPADLPHLEFPVFTVKRGLFRERAFMHLQIFTVMKVIQVHLIPSSAQLSGRFLCFQPCCELLHAAFAETASGADGRHGELTFVQLNPRDPRINLNLDDFL